MHKLPSGFLIVGVIASGCGGQISPSRPAASLESPTSCWHCRNTPVATGTPLTLSATWIGICKGDGEWGFGLGAYWGGGDVRDTTEACDEVDFRATVACDDGAACRIADDRQSVVPIRPGPLRATVTMTPTDGSAPRTLALDPVTVATPERIDVTCALGDDGTTGTLSVGLVAGARLIYHPRTLEVRVRGGARCASLVELGEPIVVVDDPDGPPVLEHSYRCPVDASGKVQIDATLEQFTTTAWVTCARSP